MYSEDGCLGHTHRNGQQRRVEQGHWTRPLRAPRVAVLYTSMDAAISIHLHRATAQWVRRHLSHEPTATEASLQERTMHPSLNFPTLISPPLIHTVISQPNLPC